MLRDYHSPNLFWLPDRPAPRNVGVIDFQDALAGPIGYDLASLLKDCYVSWPRARVLAWLEEWLQTEWPELKVYCTSVTEHISTIALVICGFH